jgi:hypothetical protein
MIVTATRISINERPRRFFLPKFFFLGLRMRGRKAARVPMQDGLQESASHAIALTDRQR